MHVLNGVDIIMMNKLEDMIQQILDIEIYAAEEILKQSGVEEPTKNMICAYILAINRAKKIVSGCIKVNNE